MKKIAILTQPLRTNYGGILQAYALQLIMKEMDNEVITINRTKKSSSKSRLKIGKIKNQLINKIKGKNQFLFSYKQKQFIEKHSNKFITDNIKLTEVIDCNTKLIEHFNKNKYDAVVVGSDQTWRPTYSPNIYNFYLDFLEDNGTKRIAYASSFGVNNWEYSNEQTEKCKSLLQKFNAVSVREESGISLCENYFNTTAKLVLDPTLLLEKQKYIDLFKSLDLPKNKNKLYTYVLDRNEVKNLIIKNVSEKLNLEEFKNQPKESWLISNTNNIEDYVYPPVEGWLKGFYDAEFVITDSFHGTLFSILFNKQFITIPNLERGLGRFTSILSQFSLENRMVTNNMEVLDNLLSQKINFNEVNSKLENLKIQSLDFLKQNI